MVKTFCILSIFLLLGACAPKTAATTNPVAALSGNLPISAPATARVGDSFSVDIGPLSAPDGTAINLIALTSYGPKIYPGVIRSGSAHYAFTSKDTQQSGQITLIATSGNARGSAEIVLQPGNAVEPVTPLIGGRSIIADGAHWSMVVGVPFDEFGNPVADGTQMTIQALHPGAHLEQKQVLVTHALGWMKVFSGTQAGRTLISIQAGDAQSAAHGPEGDLNEIPGWPVNFTISAPPDQLPADGRQLIPVRTSILKDKFDNVIPDGTLVTFLVESSLGDRRVIPAFTIGGVAETPLQAADQPEVLNIWASLYGVDSPHIQIGFTPGPSVGTFPVTAAIDALNQSIILQAGPLLGPLGQYVPDGTVVLFRLTDQTGQYQWLSAVTSDGHAQSELRLASLVAGNYPLEAWAGSGHGATQVSIP